MLFFYLHALKSSAGLSDDGEKANNLQTSFEVGDLAEACSPYNETGVVVDSGGECKFEALNNEATILEVNQDKNRCIQSLETKNVTENCLTEIENKTNDKYVNSELLASRSADPLPYLYNESPVNLSNEFNEENDILESNINKENPARLQCTKQDHSIVSSAILTEVKNHATEFSFDNGVSSTLSSTETKSMHKELQHTINDSCIHDQRLHDFRKHISEGIFMFNEMLAGMSKGLEKIMITTEGFTLLTPEFYSSYSSDQSKIEWMSTFFNSDNTVTKYGFKEQSNVGIKIAIYELLVNAIKSMEEVEDVKTNLVDKITTYLSEEENFDQRTYISSTLVFISNCKKLAERYVIEDRMGADRLKSLTSEDKPRMDETLKTIYSNTWEAIYKMHADQIVKLEENEIHIIIEMQNIQKSIYHNEIFKNLNQLKERNKDKSEDAYKLLKQDECINTLEVLINNMINNAQEGLNVITIVVDHENAINIRNNNVIHDTIKFNTNEQKFNVDIYNLSLNLLQLRRYDNLLMKGYVEILKEVKVKVISLLPELTDTIKTYEDIIKKARIAKIIAKYQQISEHMQNVVEPDKTKDKKRSRLLIL